MLSHVCFFLYTVYAFIIVLNTYLILYWQFLTSIKKINQFFKTYENLIKPELPFSKIPSWVIEKQVIHSDESNMMKNVSTYIGWIPWQIVYSNKKMTNLKLCHEWKSYIPWSLQIKLIVQSTYSQVIGHPLYYFFSNEI